VLQQEFGRKAGTVALGICTTMNIYIDDKRLGL